MIFFYLLYKTMAEETFKTNGNAPLPVKETISEEIHEEPTPDIEIPLEIDTHNFETLSQDTAELTEEEKLQRRQLLRKLFRYKQLFPNEVQGLPISDGADLSLHQLQILVSDVEFMVATRKSLHASRTMFLSTRQTTHEKYEQIKRINEEFANKL